LAIEATVCYNEKYDNEEKSNFSFVCGAFGFNNDDRHHITSSSPLHYTSKSELLVLPVCSEFRESDIATIDKFNRTKTRTPKRHTNWSVRQHVFWKL
jgi:hypothetical protein